MNNHLQYSKLREVMKIKKKHNYVTKVNLNEICGAVGRFIYGYSPMYI